MDMFKTIKNCEVGLTITSTDDDISRFFEVNAPPVSLRFKALKTLNEHHIKTYAFVGPLFPHYLETPEKIEEIFKTIKEVGTQELYVEQLNLSTYIRTRLTNYLKTKNPDFLEKYYLKKSKLIDDALNELVLGFVKKYTLQLRLNEVITHDQLPLH